MANTNANICSKLKDDNKFYGSLWENIRVEEMYWIFGMIFKMSLVHIWYAGIKEYFIPTKKIYPSYTNPIDYWREL